MDCCHGSGAALFMNQFLANLFLDLCEINHILFLAIGMVLLKIGIQIFFISMLWIVFTMNQVVHSPLVVHEGFFFLNKFPFCYIFFFSLGTIKFIQIIQHI